MTDSIIPDSVVLNRKGDRETIDETKIRERIQVLCERTPTLTNVDVDMVVAYVVARLHDHIQTRALDELAARSCATKVTTHPEYGTLALRIIVSDLHKSTDPSFAATTQRLVEANAFDTKTSRYVQFICAYGDILDRAIDPNADYGYTYFGLKTLIEAKYLLRLNGKVVETPQYMLMRVAVYLHAFDDAATIRMRESESLWEGAESVVRCYQMMSRRLFTHATPTLFNSGRKLSQLLSCFLVAVDDSIDGIYDALKQCALISKLAGGIGIHLHAIRSKGSTIRGVGGVSSGIVPMCRVFEMTANYVNQAGRRNGSFAMYMSPWHADVLDFLKLKRHQGEVEDRAPTLHYGLWVSDHFMRAVHKNTVWHLFCPDECPELLHTHGTPAFVKAYDTAVSAGKARRTINARILWYEYLKTQTETGQPYLLFADAANRKSNQKNLGQIRSSNLCAEIIEYSDRHETACCTLASVSLPAYVRPNPQKDVLIARGPLKLVRCRTTVCLLEGVLRLHDVPFELVSARYADTHALSPGALYDDADLIIGDYPQVNALLRPTYDYVALAETTRQVVRNLDCVIDRNHYPTPETKFSNTRHRPLGIGIQGLANVYNKLRYPFDSPEANAVNRRIAATMYYAAMSESICLAELHGSYPSFKGSPLSRGLFQFDLWDVEPLKSVPGLQFDWETLRRRVMTKGARHSLLIAHMPTASTSQILGNNECFEPFTTNIYRRETSAGTFMCVNTDCVRLLQCLDLWNDRMKTRIIANRGSLSGISEIPVQIQHIFRTAWDISMRAIIDQAATRGPYVCQSQSLNHYVERPTVPLLSSAYYYAWKKGLKTGVYYLHSRAPKDTQAVTIAPLQNVNKSECLSCQG